MRVARVSGADVAVVTWGEAGRNTRTVVTMVPNRAFVTVVAFPIGRGRLATGYGIA